MSEPNKVNEQLNFSLLTLLLWFTNWNNIMDSILFYLLRLHNKSTLYLGFCSKLTIYLFTIYWNTVKGRQTASTHRKTIVAWLPLKAVKSCPFIQFKTIYSTTLPYSSIKLWSEVLNVSTVFWLTTLSGRLFHSSNVIGK